MLVVTVATIAFTAYLYVVIPKGFFPQQDTGRLIGIIQGDQNTSFQAMSRRLTEFSNIVAQDPAVDNVIAFTGGGGAPHTRPLFLAVETLAQRELHAGQIGAAMRARHGQI